MKKEKDRLQGRAMIQAGRLLVYHGINYQYSHIKVYAGSGRIYISGLDGDVFCWVNGAGVSWVGRYDPGVLEVFNQSVDPYINMLDSDGNPVLLDIEKRDL